MQALTNSGCDRLEGVDLAVVVSIEVDIILSSSKLMRLKQHVAVAAVDHQPGILLVVVQEVFLISRKGMTVVAARKIRFGIKGKPAFQHLLMDAVGPVDAAMVYANNSDGQQGNLLPIVKGILLVITGWLFRAMQLF